MAAQGSAQGDILNPQRKMAETAEVLQDKADQLRQTAQTLYQRGKERALQWEENLEDTISEQPMRSVLVAAGVGAVVGLLLGVALARR